MDATPIQSPIPFRLAQAYGVQSPSRSAATPQQAANVAKVNAQDKVELTANSVTASAMRARVENLVAARVQGGVDFLAQGVKSTPGTLSMYRHPADKNAAATGVDVGRSLDVQV